MTGSTRASRPSASAQKPPAEGDLATASDAPASDTTRGLERALGLQVRVLRREKELSVADLAEAAGISAGMLSKIENGQISPSLATVHAVSGALHVPITALFAAFEDKRDCSYVPRGKGVVIERRGTKKGHIYELLGAMLGAEIAVEPYLITLEEGAEPYTGFRHAGTEFIYMLSGAVDYHHAGATYPLRAGDAMLFDSAAPHGPERLVETPMTYLSIIVYARTPR